MLQPTKRNANLSPVRVASGVGVVLVLVSLWTIVHVILGVVGLIIEVVVVAAVVAVAYRLFRGVRRR